MRKLTRPQIDFLNDAATDRGTGGSPDYAPIKKLVALGLITETKQRFGGYWYRATESGLAALSPTPHEDGGTDR